MDDIDDIEKVMFEIKSDKKYQKYHVSLDIDALDPKVAPSTGTPVDGGLSIDQTKAILNAVNDQTIALDLVEINPMIGTPDKVQKTIETAATILNTFAYKY